MNEKHMLALVMKVSLLLLENTCEGPVICYWMCMGLETPSSAFV